MTAPPDLRASMMAAARRGMRAPGQDARPASSGFDKTKAQSIRKRLEALGVKPVGRDSSQEDREEFVKRLEDSQQSLLEPLYREWLMHLYYIAGEQHLAYHRERRRWIIRKALPWRIRAKYNVTAKIMRWHVGRLTENRPTVTVQARTADLDDLEKAEAKEMLFWYLWDRLGILKLWGRARRLAWACGSSFLKCGYDSNAGGNYPATKKRPRMVDVMVPDPSGAVDAMGQPVQVPSQQQVGIEEYYVDAAGADLGPVEKYELDENGQQRLEKAPVPENVHYVADGEAYIDVCPAFEVLWDAYVTDPRDSWYIQHRRVLPLSRIAATIATTPGSLERLKAAKRSEEDGTTMLWTGLVNRDAGFEGMSAGKHGNGGEDGQLAELDVEYKVVETWIFPKNGDLKALWGDRGAIITTVGGIEIEKPRELPEWALRACPFIKLGEGEEEGNHYDKAPARDIIPLQDDVNRTLSTAQEGFALKARMILGAPQNHGINIKLLGAMPGVLMTYRSQEFKPEVLKLDANTEGWAELYATALSAANDLGNTNEASTGKLPSAGLSAKALYSLQYADERSISETSALQDEALKRLAEALDAITSVEYTEPRKIRLVGEDRSFMLEHEVSPEQLRVDVDYTFLPGSMLSRQKEAIRNELLALKDAGLVTPEMVLKHFPTSTPDVFRLSYNLQNAAARNVLRDLTTLETPQPHQPQPWENPAIFASVFEEFLLTEKFRKRTDPQRQALIVQTWQTYKQMQFASMQPTAPAAGGSGAPAAGGQAGPMQPPTPGMDPAAGAANLEQSATTAMSAPEPGAPGRM